MEIEVFRFLTDNEYTDREKLFFWFMTKIVQESDPTDVFTIAKYDFVAIVRGSSSGEYSKKAITDNIKEWFRIGFVTDARITIELTSKAIEYFRSLKGNLVCGTESITITEGDVRAMYLYLLGILNGSNDLFYEDKFWGVGDHADNQYHRKTRVLGRIEIQTLLNAQLD